MYAIAAGFDAEAARFGRGATAMALNSLGLGARLAVAMAAGGQPHTGGARMKLHLTSCSSVSPSVGNEPRAAFQRSNGPNMAARRPMWLSTQDSSVDG
jgi:hypothetical protein